MFEEDTDFPLGLKGCVLSRAAFEDLKEIYGTDPDKSRALEKIYTDLRHRICPIKEDVSVDHPALIEKLRELKEAVARVPDEFTAEEVSQLSTLMDEIDQDFGGYLGGTIQKIACDFTQKPSIHGFAFERMESIDNLSLLINLIDSLKQKRH